jgi:type VI protein secretion system component VasK
MNRLGDPQDSPIRKILETAYDQTSWDNPSLANVTIKKAQTGVVNWVKQWFTRSQAGQMAAANIDINGNPAEVPMGPIGQEFVGLARIVATHDGTSMLKGYMDTLSKVRTRFNVIKNQGDPGPGARQLMQQTLDGNGSELADSLKFVDEQMLTGLTDSQRKSLRPLLVRPLMQAFSVVIQPASAEVNKVWNAQVYQPFQSSLATKYPFAPNAKVEAGAGEIAQVFGPDGAIAKFVGTTLGRSRCAAATPSPRARGATWASASRRTSRTASRAGSRRSRAVRRGGAAAASNRRPCSRSCRSRAPARPNTRSRSTASNCATATRRRSGPTSCGRTRRVRRRRCPRRPSTAARCSSSTSRAATVSRS